MDSKTIKHVAGLARIRLTEKEEDKMKGELSSVLDYISQLNKVNTENVEPLYQTTGLVNSVRKDEYRKDFEMNPVRSLARAKGASPKDLGEATSNGMNENMNQGLIGQAPDRENRFIKVKPVLNRTYAFGQD